MNSGLTVDDRELILALNRMSPKKMNAAYKKAMKKSLDPIVKQTKVNLRKSGIKNVSRKYVSKKTGREYRSMLSGVMTSINMNGEDAYGKVHIMKEFRLKWFEKGTMLRKTDKGWNRGRITPRWFFKSAVDSKSKEAANTLDENIRKSIQEAFNNKR